MFSGIVEEKAQVVETEFEGQQSITVHSKLDHSQTKIGDSICVNGVCLTVTSIKEGDLKFDLLAETVRLTNLAELKAGDSINLERSLRVGDRISGHFVFGHVHSVFGFVSRARNHNQCYNKT